MHPILADRRRLAIYLLAWLLVGLLLTLGLRRDASWLVAAALFLPVSLLYAFVTLSSGYVCRAFPVDGRASVWRVVGVQSLAAAIASAAWVAVAETWATGIDSIGADTGAEALLVEQRTLLFVLGALLFWLAAALHYLLIAFEASREAETQALELRLLAREAELKALRAQIDPHFIFNSLHSISALTSIDPAAARRMCLLLADFLRETLRLGASSRIALSEEFALADRFLAIEQVRLGDRLHVTRAAEPAAVECLVPPLLLQPLVENAVVHGVAQLVEGGTITMAASREGSTLTITLENPCDPDRARTRGVGLGLELLRKRLTTQYGAYDAVRAKEEEGRFRVEVRIPIITAAAA
jgi:two-component system, LytTR family, sensor histidine kinase AlgZ